MKKAADNSVKTRRTPRFGVLDFVIILLIIVAVVGIYFRYSIIDLISNSQDLSEYTISFSVDNIRYTTPNFVNVDDEVYFESSGEKSLGRGGKAFDRL